jgi:hypothetical protein
LVIKGFGPDAETQKPLPVEEFYPEIFGEAPAPAYSDEVSRWISRHEKSATQEVLRWQICAAALGYIANHDLGPTYGVIEPWLERFLNATIPIKRVGDPKFVEHYKDVNLAIAVDTDAFIQQMQTTHPGVIEELRANEGTMTYFGKVPKTATPILAPAFVERRKAVQPVLVERRLATA